MRLKYALDPLWALVFLLLASPAIVLIMLLILLDGWIHPENRGPFFWLEKRITAGKPFYIYKFRTVPMRVIHEVLEKNPESRSMTALKPNTWAGKIILRWYLDELPQLFNVLKGEMSLVGPRPHILRQHDCEIKMGAVYRNYLKAGILGVPQACKRDPRYRALLQKQADSHKADSEVLDKLDGLYARECFRKSSIGILFYDLGLVLRGFWVIFRGEAQAETCKQNLPK